MADYKSFKSGFMRQGDSTGQKLDQAFKRVLGIDKEPEEEKKKSTAMERRAKFFSDTTGEG